MADGEDGGGDYTPPSIDESSGGGSSPGWFDQAAGGVSSFARSANDWMNTNIDQPVGNWFNSMVGSEPAGAAETPRSSGLPADANANLPGVPQYGETAPPPEAPAPSGGDGAPTGYDFMDHMNSINAFKANSLMDTGTPMSQSQTLPGFGNSGMPATATETAAPSMAQQLASGTGSMSVAPAGVGPGGSQDPALAAAANSRYSQALAYAQSQGLDTTGLAQDPARQANLLSLMGNVTAPAAAQSLAINSPTSGAGGNFSSVAGGGNTGTGGGKDANGQPYFNQDGSINPLADTSPVLPGGGPIDRNNPGYAQSEAAVSAYNQMTPEERMAEGAQNAGLLAQARQYEQQQQEPWYQRWAEQGAQVLKSAPGHIVGGIGDFLPVAAGLATNAMPYVGAANALYTPAAMLYNYNNPGNQIPITFGGNVQALGEGAENAISNQVRQRTGNNVGGTINELLGTGTPEEDASAAYVANYNDARAKGSSPEEAGLLASQAAYSGGGPTGVIGQTGGGYDLTAGLPPGSVSLGVRGNPAGRWSTGGY